MWKSQFLIVLLLRVMSSQLSVQEYNEPVTKGFLVGYLSEQEYVTRKSLEEILESKNYATKEYVHDMFVMFRTLINEDFSEQLRLQGIQNRQYLQALMEYSEEKFQIYAEKIDMKIERIERYLGMEPI